MAKVAVVIPTTGRRSLVRAVKSVLDQDTHDALEVLVVWDAPSPAFSLRQSLGLDGEERIDSPGKRGLREFFTGGGLGAAHARNMGVENATSEFVAFLDDDDVWLPTKVSAQLRWYAEKSAGLLCPLVVCSRVFYFTDLESPAEDLVIPRLGEGPRVLISDQRDPFGYLFTHRGPTYGRPAIPTSSLLCLTSIAQRVAWDESLSRHQDWDLLVKLWRHGCRFSALGTVEVGICMGSQGSISASSDWRSSLNWARSISSIVDTRPLSSFLVAQCLRYALQGRDLEGVRIVVRFTRAIGGFPDIYAMLMCLTGFVPRETALRVLSSLRALIRRTLK